MAQDGDGHVHRDPAGADRPGVPAGGLQQGRREVARNDANHRHPARKGASAVPTLTTSPAPGGLSPATADKPEKDGRRRGSRRERLVQALFLAPAALFLLLFFGYPVVKNVAMSLQEYTTRTFFTGEAPWVGLANYVTVITSQLFAPALINTALFTIGSIAGQFVIGLALAEFFR